MVDLIHGRGITDLIREMPFYEVYSQSMQASSFFMRPALYGSVDIVNICNLDCTHCYWWLNRKNEEEVSVPQWKVIIRKTFTKQKLFVVTLVGGEPTMRPDLIEVFCDEMPKSVCVVTNGTFPLKKLIICTFTEYHWMKQSKYMTESEERGNMQKLGRISLIM
ncbi:MAG: radical SAM protein [Nitrososphaerales archaeon]